MTWNNDNGVAVKWVVYFGSQRGSNDLWSYDAGTRTSLPITWTNPPSEVWIRLWSGNRNNQWATRDYLFQIRVGGSNGQGNQNNGQGSTVREASIEKAIANAEAVHGKSDNNWQCKWALQQVFENPAFAAVGAKTPSGERAIVPSNATGWYWTASSANGFFAAGQLAPKSAATSLASHKLSLESVIGGSSRGDVWQFGNASTSSSLHTALVKQGGATISYADANGPQSDLTVNAYRSITKSRLAEVIAARGLTRYAVRSDLTK